MKYILLAALIVLLHVAMLQPTKKPDSDYQVALKEMLETCRTEKECKAIKNVLERCVN